MRRYAVGYYPIFVEMRGRRVLLVGGGHVALEKIGKLVDAEADVTIVAPELIPEVRAYVDDGRAGLEQRAYRSGDVAGYEVVMIATDDGAINRRVADEARALGIWVNAADDVSNCDFILPAMATGGRITIATSTAGASPALARWLRERMQEFLAPEVVALGDLLADLRVKARERDRECAAGCGLAGTPPPLLCKPCPNRITGDAWQEAIGPSDGELMSHLREGRYDDARALLVARLGLDRPLGPRAVAAEVGQP